MMRVVPDEARRRPVTMSIPGDVLTDFDRVLRPGESRSGLVAKLMWSTVLRRTGHSGSVDGEPDE